MKNKFNDFKRKVHAGDYNSDRTPDLVEVNDPSNYAQCMDLAYAWCDFLGITRDTIRAFYAYQVYTQPKDITLEYFELIPNTPGGIPKVGDLVVFSNNVGTAGHISIASGKGDLSMVETFDQNWGTPKACRLVNHNYDAVLGWLTVRTKELLVITDQTKVPQIVDGNGNQMEVQQIRSKLNDMARDLENAGCACDVRVEQAVATANTNNKTYWEEQIKRVREDDEKNCDAKLTDLKINNDKKLDELRISYEKLLHKKVEKLSFWEFLKAKFG